MRKTVGRPLPATDGRGIVAGAGPNATELWL